jgi:hypothetical protein
MPEDKPQAKQDQQVQVVRTSEELRQKILDVRTRVQEATKPEGPLSILKVTTTT